MPAIAPFLLLAAALLLATAVPAAAEGGSSRVPLPAWPKADGARCVEPNDVMRREHMFMLQHQRDRTVHEGFREPRHSLRECVRCHVSRDAAGQTVAIHAPGQFCAACHAYAAVTIDCFECHAATPDSGSRREPGQR